MLIILIILILVTIIICKYNQLIQWLIIKNNILKYRKEFVFLFNLFNKKKSIVDLKDYEILSLAICALEEDLKYYDNYVSNFIIDYPETSKLF